MSFPSYLSIFLIFFNGKILYIYIYKGIKSQGLHQKEKIKTPKNPPKTTSTLKLLKPLTAALQRTNTANSDQ